MVFFRRVRSIWESKNTGQEKGEKRFLKRASDNASNKRGKSNDAPQVRSKSEGYNIEFSGINRTLKDGRVILNNAKGEFVAGQLTAILGPSGAGKSTLVTAIAEGQFDDGGKLEVNGFEATSLLHLKKVMGFVPQEDIMMRDLTVRQNIAFSAEYRLPREMSKNEKYAQVDRVIENLGLGHVQDEQIGDELTRGISGGQRKRTNVAMEMVALPRILILDEPTSGLDSVASLALCDALQEMSAEGNLTTVAVIHQPAVEAFECFQQVIVLARGGKTIYAGKRSNLRRYFTSIGYECSSSKNIADFALEVASGLANRNTEPQLKPDDLFNLWCKKTGLKVDTLALEREGDALVDVELGDDASDDADNEDNEIKREKLDWLKLRWAATRDSVKEFFRGMWANTVAYFTRVTILIVRELGIYQCCTSDSIRNVPGFWLQWKICFFRACSWYQSPGRILTDVAIHTLMGLLIMSTVADFGFIGRKQTAFCVTQPVDYFDECLSAGPNFYMNYVIGIEFLCWAISFAAMTSAASTFGMETATYLRDYRRGLSTTAYFTAKFCAEVPRIVVACSFFFAAMTMNFGNVDTQHTVYTTTLMVYWWSWPLGYIIEGIVGWRASPLYSVIIGLLLVVICSGLGNFTIPTRPSGIRWVFDILGIRWSCAAYLGGQLRHYEFTEAGDVWMLTDTTLALYGIDKSTSACNWRVFAIGVGTLVAALFLRIISRSGEKVKA